MSPGESRVNTEQKTMIAGIEWMSMSVPERCISAPLRQVESVSGVESGDFVGGDDPGTSGPLPAKFLVATGEYLVRISFVLSAA